ncbi:tyrosine-type recombinase/integrase [Agrobacterium salinitolerans]|nr:MULTISPECIES: tyrosine-type recombinase/integrase [Agrobacterium]MCZ7891909.1 tyrosine-type recombinase/integrase [Agrobacterium salinitolerans]
MTLDIAAGRYWTEIGHHHKNSATTFTDIRRLLDYLTPTIRMDAITDDVVASLVARRRSDTKHGKKVRKDGKPVQLIANATVNRSTIILLKSIMLAARDIWGASIPKMPRWKKHMLKEPKENVRSLDSHEAVALNEAVREDYALWFEFARITGLRRNETLIRWSDVNVFAKRITTIGKGGKEVSTPITPAVEAILKQCKGHHPEFVFTYICQRPFEGQVKGQRYPITPEGAKSQWRRLRARSGVQNFRFHGLRHDMATRLLRETGNLKIVQRALNHSDIKTTVKYAHVYDDELTAAMIQIQMPTTLPTTNNEEGEKYA